MYKVEKKRPTTASQKAINEHQTTTDHHVLSSSRQSVLRDTVKERVGTSVAPTTTVRDTPPCLLLVSVTLKTPPHAIRTFNYSENIYIFISVLC